MKRLLIVLFPLLLCACGGGSGGGATSTDTAEKKPHPGLKVEAITHDYQSDLLLPLQISGGKGSIGVGFADGEAVDVIALTLRDEVRVLNAGHTRLKVSDSGGTRYQETTSYIDVVINKASRAPLLVGDLMLSYQPYAEHQMVAEGNKGALSYALTGAPGVVEVNDSGLIRVLGVGTTEVTVSDDGGRNYQPAKASIAVQVKATDGSVAQFADLSPKPFVSGGKLKPVYAGPLQNHRQFVIAEGAAADVVRINRNSGDMDILHAGQTQVEVTQFATDGVTPVSVQRFSVVIEPVANIAFSVQDLTLDYGFDDEFTLPASGARGALTFALKQDDSSVVHLVDDALGVFGFDGIGEAEVVITDGGDRDHLPAEVTATISVDKLPSSGLTTEAIHRTYATDASFNVPVIGANGQLSFGIVDGKPEDVVSVSQDGLLRMLKPGTTTLWVNDDGDGLYQPQRATVEVTIDKRVNEDLVADNLLLQFADDALLTPVVRGNRGQLSFSVEGDDVLRQNGDGSISLIGAGRGYVTVTDSGDAFYLSSTAQFYVDVAYADGTLKVGNVTAAFVEGKQLSIPVSGVLGQLSYRYDNAQPEDVVEIDEDNRRLIIRNAGTTLIGITDSGDAGHGSRGAMMRVTIDKAPQNPALSLDQTLLETRFEDGKTVLAPTVTGQVEDGKLQFLPLDFNQQVVDLDYDSGQMTVNNAGEAKFVVTETSRNFEDTSLEYTLRVNKAAYPDSLEIEAPTAQAFVPGMQVPPIALADPKGSLHYRLVADYATSDYDLREDGTLVVHRYPQSTPINVLVTDDGGRNYESASRIVPVYFKNYEAGTGEESTLSFDGTPLVIDSPAQVAAKDASYFSVFQLGRHGATLGDDDNLTGGYSLQTTAVCLKDRPTACLNLTLRLQKTSVCPDGSQLALPLASTLVNSCSSQVTVTFNAADPFNASLPSGHFVSRTPLMLVHYARPYQSGGLIEGGETQAQVWWLLDVDVTIP
ncbi:hypothetical protein [Ferrimonas sp. SCSIO 43195]|uniref:hypothetical protein n=1 Tax=Ferrimonas sp. SCSIO 43195 TaxID=2822844 RepID=UPI0020755F20|nr:hypothetical protein [Ferrimonas sp. SCSIO 43195]USD36701.1 hypothetical protein J8Z22_17100 [Ferrimonas sp. SCSIO 43195]